MPGYRRRTNRRGSITSLLTLLLIALLLLVVIDRDELNRFLPRVNLPPLPNITIPITGLPEVQIPTIQIPLTVSPGKLIPSIGIAGTPIPEGKLSLGSRTKEQGCQISGSLPDPACTPGSVISQDTEAVCQPGYAGKDRDVSESQKDAVYAAYSINDPAKGAFKIDHLVPQSLGGSDDISNLWPDPAVPRPGFEEKEQVENYLHDQVCSGNLSLRDAQQQIASNWVEVWQKMPR